MKQMEEAVIVLSSHLSNFPPSTAHMLGATPRARRRPRVRATPRARRRPRVRLRVKHQRHVVERGKAAARVGARGVPRVHRVSQVPNHQCQQCQVMSHRLDRPSCRLPVRRRFPVQCHRINPLWNHRLLLCPAIFPRHCQVRCRRHHHRTVPQ